MKYMLRHVKPALEGSVWNVSKETNLKYCLPPSANRPQALTVFLTARKDLRAGKKLGSFWKLTSTNCVEATLQLASRPAGLFPFGSPGMLTKLQKMIRAPNALRPSRCANCDCKFITTAMCAGLRKYMQECIHQSQRCHLGN